MNLIASSVTMHQKVQKFCTVCQIRQKIYIMHQNEQKSYTVCQICQKPKHSRKFLRHILKKVSQIHRKRDRGQPSPSLNYIESPGHETNQNDLSTCLYDYFIPYRINMEFLRFKSFSSSINHLFELFKVVFKLQLKNKSFAKIR